MLPFLQYSRPPENLTSPNRESNSAIVQEIVNSSPNGKQIDQNYFIRNHNNTHSAKKRSGSGPDLFRNSSGRKSSSTTRSGNGPLAILRRSFRRSTSKKHQITSYQVSVANHPPAAAFAATTNSNCGSQERVSRKFSNPYPPSSVTSPSPKLLPGRASSPATLAKQQQQPNFQAQTEQEQHLTDLTLAMKSLVMPDDHHTLHSSAAVARASEVLVKLFFQFECSVIPTQKMFLIGPASTHIFGLTLCFAGY